MLSYGDTKQVSNVTITTTNKTWDSNTLNWTTQDYQNVLTDSSAGGLAISYSYNPIDDKDSKSLYVYNNNKMYYIHTYYIHTTYSL